jgi:arginyl-tRNA synthetase
VFNDLKRERIKDVLFDSAEILSFEGDTGPYLQYTHARLASIERKVAEAGEGGARARLVEARGRGARAPAPGAFPDVVARRGRARAEPRRSRRARWPLDAI